VAALAADINALAMKLQTLEEERAAIDAERRELTAAISHDLRTPLASMRAMVEALDDGVVDDAAEVRRYYVTMRRAIDRLSRMIDDLFELAQIDAGALRFDVQHMVLQEIVAEVADAMQPQARQHGIMLALALPDEPVHVAVDGARIERALANIVRNALEHTPAGGSVSVSLAVDGGSAVVTVTDAGEGIAPDDLEHIWKRFYRASKSRSRTNGASDDGAGLGLAIARGIIESHGGSVAATSELRRGTTVTLRLPLAPSCDARPAVRERPTAAAR
jgi:signal transduction histidine kinase